MAGACIALGAAAGPPLAGATVDRFKEVVIRNGIDDPAITKSTGVTEVAGSVSVPDGVSVNGTVPVRPVPQERVQLTAGVRTDGSVPERCEPLEVPQDKRFVLGVAFFELSTVAPNDLDGYLRVVEIRASGSQSLRYSPQHFARRTEFGITTATGRLEGPLLAENTTAVPRFRIDVCVGEAGSARVMAVGHIEDL